MPIKKSTIAKADATSEVDLTDTEVHPDVKTETAEASLHVEQAVHAPEGVGGAYYINGDGVRVRDTSA